MDQYCDGQFWNSTLILDNTWPEFNNCFIYTVFALVPCAYVWLLLPYFLYDVTNPYSTNNLIPCHLKQSVTTPRKGRHLGGKEKNHRRISKVEERDMKKAPRGVFTWLCIAKIVLTCTLAVLSAILLFLNISNEAPPYSTVTGIIVIITDCVAVFLLVYGRWKGRVDTFVSFYYYMMLMCVGIIVLYHNIMKKTYEKETPKFTLTTCSFAVSICLFIISLFNDYPYPSRNKGYKPVGQEQNTCPEFVASYASQLTFVWIMKMLYTGCKRDIQEEDVWDLNPRDQGSRLNPLFAKYWEEEVAKAEKINSKIATAFGGWVKYNDSTESTKLLVPADGIITGIEGPPKESKLKKPSLVKVLWKILWKNIIMALAQKLVADVAMYMSPLILGLLIERLQNPDPDKVWQAYVLSLTLYLTGTLKSMLFAQGMYRSALLGIHMKTVLISGIYKKALRIAAWAKKGSTVGEIVNLMSVDCQRLQEIMNMILFLWTTPIQVLLGVIFLYRTIGPSVLTGVGFLILLIPLNAIMASMQRQAQEDTLKIKDKRIKMINEILNGMKVLKLYAWEDEFKRKVEEIRGLEMKKLYRIAILYIISGLCWGIAPFLVGLFTFATYVLSDRENILDPEKAFVSLSLFNLLRVPLFMVSTVITYTVQVNVSLKRISKFLCTEDLDFTNVTWDDNAEHAIQVKNGHFTWDKELAPMLKNINLTVPDGKLVAIVGPVGSGKSSLVSAILGEMGKVKGSVTVKGTVAYVSQQAWIQNATVKDNILFGKKFNKRRYNKVLQACQLERDLEIMDAGDQTEIGEKGINLSGGQKQRVNLARAVYSNSDIYLFDDPLSAVDSHVGKAIFKQVMGPQGLLAKKTRILVTHGVHWLPQVDDIVVLSNGAISEHGSYKDLVAHDGPFAQFMKIYLLDGKDNGDDKLSDDSDNDDEIRELKKAMLSDVEKALSDTGNVSTDEFNYFTRRDSIAKRKEIRERFRGERSISQPKMFHESFELTMTMTTSISNIHHERGRLIVDEKLETGKVKSDVFITYGHAAGICAMLTGFFAYALNQGFSVWSSFWLTTWTQDQLILNSSTVATEEGIARSDFYLGVYGGCFGIAQLLTFLVFNYLFWFRMVRAAKRLHALLLERLFHAPMSFYDQTPIGRILNRFSRDVDTVDNTLPIVLRDTIFCAALIFVTLIVVMIQTPIFGAVLIPLFVIFYVVQHFYIKTSRQLKRIESIARSPIYVHFSESVTGAAVIRAYRASERFIAESQRRVDKNQVYVFASTAALRWLQLNMDNLANFVTLFAAIFQITSGGSGSDAGLSVSYALQVSGTLTYMVRQICEFETNVVSVERMKEYSQVEQEAELVIPGCRPPRSWPNKGDVIFNNYQTRYREGLDLVLRGVNCHIRPGEKIGIVGRTGAGKSSLTLCLFRIIEAVSGSIQIDGINISNIGLHDLRSKLTILPQDPVLFSGTLRMNLDPFEEHTDEQLWKALERAHLKDFVQSQAMGLMYECGEEGANLSVGQRQLVCLARSLLRRTKILILDEATAAIDMETDTLIQTTIREAFKDCTILAIAHRLNTIMDYDRIMVMDAGVIREFDPPQSLLKDKNGIFYSMCVDAGLA